MAFKTWADGEVLYAADLNTNFTISTKSKYTKIVTNTINDAGSWGLVFMGTDNATWLTQDKISTDSGATWSAGGFSDALCNVVDKGTTGISSTLAGATDFTADSGVTWTASGTQPPNVTNIYDIHMFSAGVSIAVGVANTGPDSWLSSDGGDTWVQSSASSSSTFLACRMASATIGYAIHSDGSIWKTTDAGDNWVDTTDNIDSGGIQAQETGIHCIDTDTILILAGRASGVNQRVYHYVNSTNTVLEKFEQDEPEANWSAKSIVTADNGNVYWMLCYPNVGAAANNTYELWMWDGTYLYRRNAWSQNENAFTNGLPALAHQDNYIYIHAFNSIAQIDVRGD